MIFVGIDDTDIVGSKGTNQLAKAIAREVAGEWRCVRIVRHQLLDDPRVPYTSRNGSASLSFEPRGNGGETTFRVRSPQRGEGRVRGLENREVVSAPFLDMASIDDLTETCRRMMRDWFIEGSDPGLCIMAEVGDSIVEFGRRCQREVVSQEDANSIARSCGVLLEGLGGTNGGVIGALAAVGLAKTGNDGRIVQLGDRPEDLSGPQPIATIHAREVVVRDFESHAVIERGRVDIGKKLRPNLRGGEATLFVTESPGETDCDFTALKLP